MLLVLSFGEREDSKFAHMSVKELGTSSDSSSCSNTGLLTKVIQVTINGTELVF